MRRGVARFVLSLVPDSLSKKETLEKLIRYVITVPDADSKAGDDKAKEEEAGPPRLNKSGNPRYNLQPTNDLPTLQLTSFPSLCFDPLCPLLCRAASHTLRLSCLPAKW
jgi:hypothetical protein